MNRKLTIDDLAIVGGKPAFSEQLHVGRPNIGVKEHLIARIEDMLERRWLTNNGPYVQELENKIAAFVGVKHCVAMCNATVALEIVIRALGLSGEVIVPSFTFIATVHALQWQEITPVFCDIAPRTHNMDPEKVEQLITPRTTGMIGVHLWGRGCDVDALQEIAAQRRLKLLFDAAHAFACSHQGRMIGGFGNAEVFSFHATKFFNTFEGGAVTTNDDDLAAKIRIMRNFGFAGYDNVVYIGTNGKMSEVSAAMGITSLESLGQFIEINRRNHDAYRKYLVAIPGVSLIAYDQKEQNNYQYVVLEIDEARSGISRDLLVDVLWSENVIARRYFYPGCHRMEPYRLYFPHAGLMLPETEIMANKLLLLPTGSSVSEDDVALVTEIIRTSVLNCEKLKQRFSEKAGRPTQFKIK
jgi:dTDP-4-amino-4,6-dideoxygalactose transaminase